MGESAGLLQGTLELLVLKALSLEPMHGWGIGQRLGQLSKDALVVTQGSLYPALQRMVRRGLLRSEWRVTANHRRARYYALTREGRARLAADSAAWRRDAAVVNGVLRARLAGGNA